MTILSKNQIIKFIKCINFTDDDLQIVLTELLPNFKTTINNFSKDVQFIKYEIHFCIFLANR
jgi:hypothetical protein